MRSFLVFLVLAAATQPALAQTRTAEEAGWACLVLAANSPDDSDAKRDVERLAHFAASFPPRAPDPSPSAWKGIIGMQDPAFQRGYRYANAEADLAKLANDQIPFDVGPTAFFARMAELAEQEYQRENCYVIGR